MLKPGGARTVPQLQSSSIASGRVSDVDTLPDLGVDQIVRAVQGKPLCPSAVAPGRLNHGAVRSRGRASLRPLLPESARTETAASAKATSAQAATTGPEIQAARPRRFLPGRIWIAALAYGGRCGRVLL
ncbi:hypothetical protein GCM10010381_13990 [Streptomyces xantholiticus]|nr:hypothetical protein GCM10010381_13990 [Streptomyces xantholiticus]